MTGESFTPNDEGQSLVSGHRTARQRERSISDTAAALRSRLGFEVAAPFPSWSPTGCLTDFVFHFEIFRR
jgi:hypothetical protein